MNCNNLLQFDTLEKSSRLIDFYTSLSLVNEQNYELAKQNLSGNFLDIFAGNFDNFKEKKSTLTELLIDVGYSDVQNNYRHHILSPVGAKAYAECIRETSGRLLSVWVEATTDTQIAIGVRNGLGGSSLAEISFEGKNIPSDKKIKLSSNSEDILLFDYNPKEDFMIKIRSEEKMTGEVSAEILNIPKIRDFKLVADENWLTGYMEIGAGGYGNQMGNDYCKPLTFVADPGYELLPEYLKQFERKVVARHPILSFVEVQKEDDEHPEIKRYTISATSIKGSDDHTQSQEKIFYKILQRKWIVMEA